MTAPDAEPSTSLAGAEGGDLIGRPSVEFRHLPKMAPTEPSGYEATSDVLGVVGHGAAVRHVLDQVRQVASTDSTVLLLGETGTGKELFATRVHQLSARRARPMVKVNCAAIPDTLIESELFGREKGAFTGALARQIGRFELADHSTIFLDEIGDLAPDTQVKLLRVLEEKEIERLGSPRSVRVDTRIIAATHRDLECRVAEGRFREDLYYRLNVFPIRVPPLRERKEDIPLLVWWFVDEFSRAFGKRIDTIGRRNMAALQDYPWPGNIRELRNVVERAMIGATGHQLTLCLPQTANALGSRSAKLMDVEREHILRILERTNWRIRGAGAAAEQLGLKPTTLETRMAKLGLRRPAAVFVKHARGAPAERNPASTRHMAVESGSSAGSDASY
jgi:transcriptional regulator with GAF, ATPase, and Fis domain